MINPKKKLRNPSASLMQLIKKLMTSQKIMTKMMMMICRVKIAIEKKNHKNLKKMMIPMIFLTNLPNNLTMLIKKILIKILIVWCLVSLKQLKNQLILTMIDSNHNLEMTIMMTMMTMKNLRQKQLKRFLTMMMMMMMK